MTERPILFSAPMVRAILAGTKTQTRRVVRIPPQDGAFMLIDGWPHRSRDGETPYPDGMEIPLGCPFGVPGDQLWVRESGWYHVEHYEQDEDSECCSAEFFRWKATPREGCRRWLPPLDQTRVDRITFLHDSTPLEHAPKGDPRPSIFMPRWASRITLEVTGVRVERLQEITEEDIEAEGVACPRCNNTGYKRLAEDFDECDYPSCGDTARPWWIEGWDTINGKLAAWESNPWVWVLGFRRVQP